MLKEGLVSGSQDNKEESARCLILIIHMSSATTLTAGRVVMAIAGPLIRVLGDRYGVNVKVAVLETLVELVRKVLYLHDKLIAEPYILLMRQLFTGKPVYASGQLKWLLYRNYPFVQVEMYGKCWTLL